MRGEQARARAKVVYLLVVFKKIGRRASQTMAFTFPITGFAGRVARLALLVGGKFPDGALIGSKGHTLPFFIQLPMSFAGETQSRRASRAANQAPDIENNL